MRVIATFIGLVFAATVVSGQVDVQPSPRPINPICEMGFRQALATLDASPAPATSDTAAEAPASPQPSRDPTMLDAAIRFCASLVDWQAGVAMYPELLSDTDPVSTKQASVATIAARRVIMAPPHMRVRCLHRLRAAGTPRSEYCTATTSRHK
jgi:hypothetical protein